MAYIPKSKVNILNTPGGEFLIRSTNQEYIGDYIELSNGKYYAGNNPTQLGQELIIPLSFNKLGESENVRLYSILRPENTKFQIKVKTIYPSKTLPTEEDYNREYYIRYFAKKVNEEIYQLNRPIIDNNFDVLKSTDWKQKAKDEIESLPKSVKIFLEKCFF